MKRLLALIARELLLPLAAQWAAARLDRADRRKRAADSRAADSPPPEPPEED